ncbi:MAG: NUDIX hydrolase [Anaerolineales bacterium]
MAQTVRASFPLTVHVIFRREDRVLLLRRHNTGYRDGWYSLVAGHVEVGEKLTQAARREVLEEIGVEVKNGSFKMRGVMHRRSNDQRIDFFLEAAAWQGAPVNREPGKCSGIGWFDQKELPEKTVPYIRRALGLDPRSFWWAEFGWD